MIDTKNIYNVLDGVTAIFCRHDPMRPELTAHLEIGRTYTVYAMSGQRTFSKIVLEGDEREYSPICFRIFDHGVELYDWHFHPRYIAPYIRKEILRGEFPRMITRWRKMGAIDPRTGELRMGPPANRDDQQVFIGGGDERGNNFRVELPNHFTSAVSRSISDTEVLLCENPRCQIIGVKGSIWQEKEVEVVALFEYIGLAALRAEMYLFLTKHNMPSDQVAFASFEAAPDVYYSPARSGSIEKMLDFVSERGYTSLAMNGVRMRDFSELRNLRIICDWLERHPESPIRTIRLVDLRGGFCKVRNHRLTPP